MCQIVLFQLLGPRELAKFCQISKDCNKLLDPRSTYCVNFKVLIEEVFGIKLTPAEVEETLISTSRALQIAEKYLKLKSFIRCEVVGTEANITGMMNVPNQRTLDGKSIQELSKLAFEKVQWNDDSCVTFGITINNGESVKSGTYYDFTKSHTFD